MIEGHDFAGFCTGQRQWTVVRGDCLDVIPMIPPEFRTIVAADPTYGYGSYPSDKDVTLKMLRAVKGWRTLALKGYAPDLYRWLHAAGVESVQEWIAWYPTNHACKANGNSKGLPKFHEDWAVCGETPGSGRLMRPRADHKVSQRINELHRTKNKDHARQYDPRGDAREGDVWTDPSPGIAFQARLRLHPNEMPVSLALKLVNLISEPGDYILDPFAGSFSLGVAAIRLGRRYIGIEISEEWAAQGVERLQAEAEGSTLQARKAGQMSLLGATR
ncbi:MAG: site-specific DNA-methyltransferase [Parcubacteria group bacterium]